MSKNTGDKSRSNRQQKQKLLQRKRSRGLGKLLERKAAVPSSTEDGNQVVSSRLRQLTVDGKVDPTALEIVVSQSPQGVANG